MENSTADILILGYGPAGISAALYGLRAGLDVLIVGKDGGALSKAHAIQNYYGLEKPLTGEELLKVGKKQALELGAKIVDDEVMDLMFDGTGFVAKGLVGDYRRRSCGSGSGGRSWTTTRRATTTRPGTSTGTCTRCRNAC